MAALWSLVLVSDALGCHLTVRAGAQATTFTNH